MYSRLPIKIKNIYITNTTQSQYSYNERLDTGKLYYSSNGSSWTQFNEWSCTNTGYGASWTINCNSPVYVNYYKFSILTAAGTFKYPYIGKMVLDAYTQTSVANSITFPTSHTNTKYSFSLGNVGSYNTSYTNTKYVSGMSLVNPESSNGTMNWMTLGY